MGLRAATIAGALALTGIVLGLAFAGSPGTIADGVRVAGVDVGGLDPQEAQALLERKAKAAADVPVTFRVGPERWRLRPGQLGIKVDWRAAVADARRQGEGFGPVRGFKRIDARVFGSDVTPPARVWESALDFELDRIQAAVDHPHREAAIVLRGLLPVVVPGDTGRVLDRKAAAVAIVRALSAFDRRPVELPVTVDAPDVTAAALAPVAAQARTVLSAPLLVTLGPTQWRLPRWRLAGLLSLPRDGRRTLRIGGQAADAWFAKFSTRVNRAPRDADFAVGSAGVRIVPAEAGVRLDVARSAQRMLAAASSPAPRRAALVVVSEPAKRSTAQARQMGITGLVGSYTTFYGGDPNRVHNVQLVSHLVDHRFIAPGATFSFNDTTGERSAGKGFLEAPVIINGELKTGIGGGVCQVSTTVFNAAYEGGLRITARTNHALYISHYPQGRDATVNYPDIDLKFVNDTANWLLLRTFVGSSSLTVNLYGTPTHRRVETETSPLVVEAQPPLKRVGNPELARGQSSVEDYGEPARSTSVERRVFDARGKLLYDDTWRSYYRAEPKIVIVGTKVPEKPAEPKPKPGETTTTDTTATTTTSTSTTSTSTTPPPPQP